MRARLGRHGRKAPTKGMLKPRRRGWRSLRLWGSLEASEIGDSINPSTDFKKYAISNKFDFDVDRKKFIDKKNGKEYESDVLDNKIMVYEDRQRGWFFDIADCLKRDNQAGFIILMIATSYLEGNQQFREGEPSKGDETETLKRAIRRVFPEPDNHQVDLIASQVRHGFFHDGMIRKNIFIDASTPDLFLQKGENLLINPHQYLDRVKQNFDDYIKELKDKKNVELKENFEKMWGGSKGQPIHPVPSTQPSSRPPQPPTSSPPGPRPSGEAFL